MILLRLLSSLFNDHAERHEGADAALIDKAIERAVVGTDKRLHALGEYRQRLREPVERAVQHVIELVDALPPPADISPLAFSEDPRVRALFVSTAHLGEVLAGFKTVRGYLADLPGPPPDAIYGLLTMVREERKVFAMELADGDLRRDVLQSAVNFSSHRYLGPAATEAASRLELKKRAFDFLVEAALERIVGERGKRLELGRQHHLLRQKLEAMKAGSFGLTGLLNGSNGGEGNSPDLAALEAEIEAIEAELGEHPVGDSLSLEESLACVADTLARPADWLAARPLSLRLDYRGIKVADAAASSANEIALTELFSSTGLSRTVLLGRILRADIPAPPDYRDATKHYL